MLEGTRSGLLALLRDYSIPAVAARPAATRAAALRAAAEIGYPVVVTTDEPGIAHKSDVGGVRLGLADPAAAAAAYDDLPHAWARGCWCARPPRQGPSWPWVSSATRRSDRSWSLAPGVS